MASTQLSNASGVISPTNPLDIKIGGLPTVVRSGAKTVASAGTRERLVATTTPLVAGQVIIKALPANTNVVYVGGSDVSAANGLPLAANEETVVFVADAMNIWLDAGAATQSVRWIAS